MGGVAVYLRAGLGVCSCVSACLRACKCELRASANKSFVCLLANFGTHLDFGSFTLFAMAQLHPLRSSWVAWEQYDTDGNDYADEMEEIVDFSTVEGFWRFFENFPKMSEILFDGMTKKQLRRVVGKQAQSEGNIIRALSVFKKGVRPEWEAKGNAGGGFFALKRLNNLRQLDALYEALAVGVVGGSADRHNVINGIRVVDKSARGLFLRFTGYVAPIYHALHVLLQCLSLTVCYRCAGFWKGDATISSKSGLRAVLKSHWTRLGFVFTCVPECSFILFPNPVLQR